MIRWPRAVNKLFTAALFCAAFTLHDLPAAHAACANPTGMSGEIVYNLSEGVLQGCMPDDTWQAFHQPSNGASGPTNCPSIGDTCDDGSIYAGLSPDGNVEMYTTLADAPSTYSWNDGTTNYTDTSMANCSFPGGPETTCRSGEANTSFLVGASGEPDYPFAAAEYCEGLTVHSYDDWYLPAQDELDVLYSNKNTGDLNGTFDETGSNPTGYYWSSSELNSSYARLRKFDDGTWISTFKNTAFSVRCVRKEGGNIGCQTPTGQFGEVIYNSSESVFQGCTEAGWQALHTAGSGGGGCSNPTGQTGEIIYNGSVNAYQGCTVDGWMAFHALPPNECTGTTAQPTVGETCTDGSVYAGLSPDGNVPMYTTPADAPSTYSWNDGTTNYTDMAMANCLGSSPGPAATCQTGEANTAFLVGATSEPDYPFAAAEYCDGLSAHGYSDWYLPAQDELNVLYTNKNTGDLNGTFDESGSPYWASAEGSFNTARIQVFSNGGQGGGVKSGGRAVRCVRR